MKTRHRVTLWHYVTLCGTNRGRGILVSMTSYNLKNQIKGYWIGNILGNLYKMTEYWQIFIFSITFAYLFVVHYRCHLLVVLNGRPCIISNSKFLSLRLLFCPFSFTHSWQRESWRHRGEEYANLWHGVKERVEVFKSCLNLCQFIF